MRSELFSSGKLCFDTIVNEGAQALESSKKRLKKEAVPIGYPCKDRKGSQFIFEEQYGMSSVSEHKDVAEACDRVIELKDGEVVDTKTR